MHAAGLSFRPDQTGISCEVRVGGEDNFLDMTKINSLLASDLPRSALCPRSPLVLALHCIHRPQSRSLSVVSITCHVRHGTMRYDAVHQVAYVGVLGMWVLITIVMFRGGLIAAAVVSGILCAILLQFFLKRQSRMRFGAANLKVNKVNGA